MGTKNTFSLLAASLILGASIVLGLWLGLPRYVEIGEPSPPVTIMDTRTGTMWAYVASTVPGGEEEWKVMHLPTSRD